MAVGVLVVINSGVGLVFARRRWSIENTAAQFTLVIMLNLAVIWVARALTPRFNPDHAMFFVLLISLIIVLYDRYRPVRNFRLGVTGANAPVPPQPA